jgi:antibiotic biosynthesis monooxygenase (ABM) superfamily enzyme
VSNHEPVTVAITRIVKPGCEEAFEGVLHGFVQDSLHLPSQLGVRILRPPPGSGSHEQGILRRLENAEARDESYWSPLFEEWKQKVVGLVEGEPRYERVS